MQFISVEKISILTNQFFCLPFKYVFLNSRFRFQLIFKLKSESGSRVFFRSSHCRCSIKKAFLKNFAIFKENTCVRVSLIKLQAYSYFEKHLETTASSFWFFVLPFPSSDVINPFVPNVPFLYPLKTSENLTVFQCFQGLGKGCIGNEWVNMLRWY